MVQARFITWESGAERTRTSTLSVACACSRIELLVSILATSVGAFMLSPLVAQQISGAMDMSPAVNMAIMLPTSLLPCLGLTLRMCYTRLRPALGLLSSRALFQLPAEIPDKWAKQTVPVPDHVRPNYSVTVTQLDAFKSMSLPPAPVERALVR